MRYLLYIFVSTIAVLLSFTPAFTAPATISFDDIQGPTPINDHYLNLGVKFFKGNDQYGNSTGTLGSAWAYPAPWAAVSQPNVLVSEPGSNNDILIWFFSGNVRTTASYVSVKNDIEAGPYNIYLAAYDASGALLGEVLISGGGTLGEINSSSIWYAKIYSAPGSPGLLGVDDFSFEIASPVAKVDIDIKPGSFPNSINLSSAGVIPVAILSTSTFNATTINPDTVSLAGARVKMVGKSNKFLCHQEDVNGDGLLDIICQVETAQFMIEEGASIAVLEAQTFDGTQIRGEDSVNIVP